MDSCNTDRPSLYDTTSQLAKLNSHATFLNNCIQQSKIPNGLRITLKPSVSGTPSKRFLSRWSRILNTASLQLMQLILNRTDKLAKQKNTERENLIQETEKHHEKINANRIISKNHQLYSHLQDKYNKSKSKKLNNLKPCNIKPQQNVTTKPRKGRNRRLSKPTINSPNSETIVNLSNRTLTKPEISLLSKGLNFCPTPATYDRGCLVKDTESFSRRLRLKCHFSKPEPLFDNSSSQENNTQEDSTNDSSNTPKFINKSTWQPPKQTSGLETFISNIQSDIHQHAHKNKTKSNLTKQEKDAIRSLKQCDTIVIKPADKGSATVIMDKEDYITEANRQLNDTNFYKKLSSDPTLEFHEKVKSSLNKMLKQGHISTQNLDYLTVDHPKPGRFYLLPKIHKQGNPGRPIVSANGHPTEKISEYIDFHLRPHVTSLPSYVQDTTDYLKKVETTTIPPNTLLVSMDVTSLYTNIPHDEGIEACREVWETRTIKEPPTETLVELLTLILKCNNFEFNGEHFLQVQGTAMGTKMAPSYANIFMGRLERQLLNSVTLKPHQWLRFIDDIDMQWPHGKSSLDTFLEASNKFHPTIKFTSEISNDSHVFLDTISCIENNKIQFDLYTKPTDKHQYLLPTSCHPKHCCKNIPYSLALRVRRICSQENTFDNRSKELEKHLTARKYSKHIVQDAIKKAKSTDRETLLSYKEVTPQAKIPFVVTYHPELPDIRGIIDKNWSTIESSKRLSKVFPERPLIAYRRPKSLRDILVTAKIKPDSNMQNGLSEPCKTSRCQTCKSMSPTAVFKNITGTISSIKGKNNCKSSNAIYLMTCKKCGKQYVGETKLPVSRRMNLHRSDWKTRKFSRSPVAEHFCSDQHSFDDISLCVIETNTNWSDKERKDRETYWIRRLNTLQPNGINKGD